MGGFTGMSHQLGYFFRAARHGNDVAMTRMGCVDNHLLFPNNRYYFGPGPFRVAICRLVLLRHWLIGW